MYIYCLLIIVLIFCAFIRKCLSIEDKNEHARKQRKKIVYLYILIIWHEIVILIKLIGTAYSVATRKKENHAKQPNAVLIQILLEQKQNHRRKKRNFFIIHMIDYMNSVGRDKNEFHLHHRCSGLIFFGPMFNVDPLYKTPGKIGNPDE